MTLDQLTKGTHVRVVTVDGEDALSMRLLEMGILEGTEIEFLGKAPLGDPLEFRLRGYRLCLRRNEAMRVTVEPV